jgi:hypothetical protein
MDGRAKRAYVKPVENPLPQARQHRVSELGRCSRKSRQSGFLGHYDGTFAAYDANTLNEMWSFNVGSPIQAPPVSYSVNGKQYIAVLVGASMSAFIMQNAPELKNQSTASMLYVFAL